MVPLSTITDQQLGWRIVDPVVRLRALETGELYPLPDPAQRVDAVLGSGGASALQLHDPSGRVSHRHARLAWDGQRWALRDLESKNGLWSDGVQRQTIELVPGVEVRLGGLTLLAESIALLRLRALVARLIGWSDDQRREVDRALRGLRDAALLRASLVLCGAGDLVPIARRLHRETLGPDRPFLACGPGDRAGALLRRARDGTLCASAREPPEDLAEAIEAALTTACATRLTLHAPDALAASPLGLHLGATVWLELPSLYRRRAELPRLVAEAAEDAAAELGQPFAPLRDGDAERLAASPFAGLAELHDAARRLVALRALGTSAGAAWLGITHGALSRWAHRRGLPA